MIFLSPPTEQQLLIRQALNEDVTTRDSDLKTIKQWLKKEQHLPDEWDDTILMNFLRNCNFSLEKTKRKLDLYFTLKTAIPEFFTNCDVTTPQMTALLHLTQLGTMPKMTEGRRIHVARFVTGDFDLADVDYVNIAKILLMLADLRFKLEEFGTAGEIYVLDAKNVAFRHVIKISPTLAKKFLACALDALPLKVKGVHVVNANPAVDFLVRMVKPFVKEKIFRRIWIHKDLASLHEHVPTELLPEEFGGTAGKMSVYMDKYMAAFGDFADWFKEEEGLKADETKRIGKIVCYEELFGMAGSFKQLTID